jgi:hypothetical protein
MSVRFSITLSFKDYIAANVLYQKRYWLWSGVLKTFCGGSFAFFLLLVIFTALDGPITWEIILGQLFTGIAFGVGMTVFIPILSLFMMRIQARRTFEQLSLGLPALYEIDEEGLRGGNEQASVKLPWNAIRDFVEDGRLLLIRRTSRIFFVVPKSQVAKEQLRAVMTYLGEAGVKRG